MMNELKTQQHTMKTSDEQVNNVLYVTSDDKVHVDETTAATHAEGLKDKTIRTLNEQENELMVNRQMMTDDEETDEGYVSEEGW
jgi:hypothetical protein